MSTNWIHSLSTNWLKTLRDFIQTFYCMATEDYRFSNLKFLHNLTYTYIQTWRSIHTPQFSMIYTDVTSHLNWICTFNSLLIINVSLAVLWHLNYIKKNVNIAEIITQTRRRRSGWEIIRIIIDKLQEC